MSEEAFDDIANAIHGLRRAFMKHGLKPPVSLELGDAKDGDFFRYIIGKDMIAPRPFMGNENKGPEWVCDLLRIEVRMPAAWRQVTSNRRVLSDPDFYSPPAVPIQSLSHISRALASSSA